VASLLAGAGGEARTEATGQRRALACPWHGRARSGASWRHWARAGLGRAVLSLANGEYRQVQWSEESLFDKVTGTRDERRGELAW
jgi:hypothetical protein